MAMMLAMEMGQATGQRLARGQEMMLAMVMFQATGQARGQETETSYRARLLRPCCV